MLITSVLVDDIYFANWVIWSDVNGYKLTANDNQPTFLSERITYARKY